MINLIILKPDFKNWTDLRCMGSTACLSISFEKGNNFLDFLFPFLDDKSFRNVVDRDRISFAPLGPLLEREAKIIM